MSVSSDRKLTITAEVRQGYGLFSVLEGAGEPVERSTYEITHTLYLPDDVTLEDVHHAIVALRDQLGRKGEAA